MLLKAAATLALLELNPPAPPLLDLCELALAAAFGAAMGLDWFCDAPAEWWRRMDSLFGRDCLNVAFLALMAGVQIVREAVRLAWKHRQVRSPDRSLPSGRPLAPGQSFFGLFLAVFGFAEPPPRKKNERPLTERPCGK